MPFLIDNAAREVALRQWALPDCLHVPIAAVDEAAITAYIGEIEEVLAGGSPRKAFLVRTKEPPSIDTQLPIWEIPAQRYFMNAGRFGCISDLRAIAAHTGWRFQIMKLKARS
jgi:hypothetical protein